MNIRQQLRAIGSGVVTFDDVKAQFETATFTTRQPTRGDWGAVWARAEEGPDDDDVPEAVHSATYAKHITKQQGQQLLDIYKRKVSPSV